MTAVARRTILSIQLVLASAGTASAECAWVLWAVANPPRVAERTWGPQQAFTTDEGGKQECEGRR